MASRVSIAQANVATFPQAWSIQQKWVVSVAVISSANARQRLDNIAAVAPAQRSVLT